MSTWNLLAQWSPWVAALAAPLHRRLAWRLPIVVAGILLASGRRTVTGWCRGAEVTTGVRSYYYFLDVVGRKTQPMAAQLLKIRRKKGSGAFRSDEKRGQEPLFLDVKSNRWRLSFFID